MFRLIETLKDFEASTERLLAQLAAGAAPKKKKAKYIRVNEALQRLADNTFGNGIPNVNQVLVYVDTVAYQL